jgi:selenocysteine lyase/cysteine desulfurase
MPTTRRELLGSLSAAAASLTLAPGALLRAAQAAGRAGARPAEELARDEDVWREVQLSFTLDRSVINLNNGGVSPSPRVVHESFKRYLDLSNQAPAYHMWQLLEPNKEVIRRRLARSFGCDPEELALTRNASEALQIAQLGVDLRPGDEVVTTNQDYPRMLDTWDQRARRDGIVVRRLSFPVPPAAGDLLRRVREALSPRTRVLHFCHITNLTGQIFPVAELCHLARQRDIRTIVDGAHAYGHFPFSARDLGCDCYGTSLHKWLLAPVGTGFLYLRRELIERTWPLTPASATLARDIRKFEEIGTHPAANHLAVAEALVFHETIGAERKAARLRYLRDRWALRLPAKGGRQARLLTNLDPAQSCAIATVALPGLDAEKAAEHLFRKHRILVAPIKHPEFSGLRVTPNVYTTLAEIDAFAEALGELLEKGLG